MIYYIDFSSDEAFYLQLRNQIIMGIATARLRDGESLPSVRDMAEIIGINMHTVNKTYAILRQEGYLRLDRRRGAVVSVNPDRQRKLESFKANLKVSLAEALCNGISTDEIHSAVDEVLKEITEQ
ncbi:MAG: GntR family transcriptional regulator [Lachnospiraceae bacterium]|nr:GntR family transcriptional regulator [Lachnospiraceae bacterium]MBO4558717.1 GntR family transcriptional regulator [Lachnospiraceae bacterium]